MCYMVSQVSEEVEIEWKTLRLPATSYYKLTELMGFMSVIMESKIALSFMASMIIDSSYASMYPALLRIVSNPQELGKARAQAKESIEYLMKILQPLAKDRER